MKITRQRLKEIIIEELALQEATPEIVNTSPGGTAYVGNAPADSEASSEEIGEISEGEGMELVQQVAQVLFDTGVTAAESPQELALALKGIGKMALLALGGGAMGVAGVAGADALNKLAADNADSEVPETALEEEELGTLGDLIKQAVQEQLSQMRD
tara:strand:- start:3031 stop:3501 length:471 start_codon:yes stop_codon:yes gene_type:complete